MKWAVWQRNGKIQKINRNPLCFSWRWKWRMLWHPNLHFWRCRQFLGLESCIQFRIWDGHATKIKIFDPNATKVSNFSVLLSGWNASYKFPLNHSIHSWRLVSCQGFGLLITSGDCRALLSLFQHGIRITLAYARWMKHPVVDRLIQSGWGMWQLFESH